MKAAPSALLPGTATKKLPGVTLRLSKARPDTASPAKGLPFASGKRSPRRFAERPVMASSAGSGTMPSSRAPGADAHHRGERLSRRIEMRRQAEHGRHALDDSARHGCGVPAGRGEAVRLGQALGLVEDGQEQVAGLIGGSDGHEGGEKLVLGVAAADDLLGRAGLAADEIARYGGPGC